MTSENCCCQKWYWRKRTWLLVVTVLLVYFCLVPSRFKPTYETTGLRNPVVKHGKVDYFGAYEATYIDRLVPPEQNGMRDIIAALGPVVLEQLHMADTVPWDEMPTNENPKNWFETYWVPLCEHMSIDPYKKPRFYAKRGFYSAMAKLKKEKKAAAGDVPLEDDDPSDQKLWEKLVSSPWKAEDEPVVAAWLADYSPALDLFGRAVRKPNYVCWHKPAESLIYILLPEVQSTRDFARNLRIRITERLGRDDLDGAWYDVMSMLHLARHFKQDPTLVVNLVGIAIQTEGIEAVKLILLHPAIDDNHLQRFAAELENLPPNTLTPDLTKIELLYPHSIFHALSSSNEKWTEMMSGAVTSGVCCKQPSIIDYFLSPSTFAYPFFDWLPLDRNLAGKHLTKLQEEICGDHWKRTPPLINAASYDQKHREQCQSFRLGIGWQLLRLPLIRTRSQMAAELIFRDAISALGSVQNAFNRSAAHNEMLRTAIAILRYKNVHHDYPETLDALVPDFLEIYPLNPFTGRANFVYKREPGELYTRDLQSSTPTPFRLYAIGTDGIDDGGIIKEKTPTEISNYQVKVFF